MPPQTETSPVQEMFDFKSAKTREAYLGELIDNLSSVFHNAGFPLPQTTYRVSVGFPSSGGLGQRKRTLGECWHPAATKDGAHHIFINPTVDDVAEAAAILVHELCHAAVGPEAKHGRKFLEAARALGLEGKATETHAGEQLKATLKNMTDMLGAYPHSALTPTMKEKKQTTRLLKIVCGEGGKIILRGAKSALADGMPKCPCHDVAMVLEEKEDDDADDADA